MYIYYHILSYLYLLYWVITALTGHLWMTPVMFVVTYNLVGALWVEPLAASNGKKTRIFGCQWIPLGKAITNINSKSCNFHNVLPLHNKPFTLGNPLIFLANQHIKWAKGPEKEREGSQKKQGSSFSNRVFIIFQGPQVKTSPPSWHLRLVS